ncbi:hypothetical protein [Streptacidiphilus sp. MAP12-20]|uniref:hypothetical protein n=1 Tax=Streptacidiphilus sp. MAP12-20 TaxID=3156299 RepID=UPI0035174265
MHDGTVVQDGSTYYMYGTQYACGFTWGVAGTPFCGFAARTAASLSGPWSAPRPLFRPSDLDNWGPDKGRTWNWVCGSTGAGCFNPRMIHRPDGVWMLWFNAPRDSFSYHANAYYVMGCNGPAGPCGYQAGAPHGSTSKPRLRICGYDGDFSILTSGRSAAIICSMGGISEERLNNWWADGTGMGTRVVSGAALGIRPSAATAADPMIPIGEGEGAYRRPDKSWEMTYSLPGCAYCSGPPALLTAGGARQVRTGHAVAPTMMGPWTPRGPRSPAYCTGQPRTVFTAAGRPYEWMDRWTGARNEATAAIGWVPLATTPWSCR